MYHRHPHSRQPGQSGLPSQAAAAAAFATERSMMKHVSLQTMNEPDLLIDNATPACGFTAAEW